MQSETYPMTEKAIDRLSIIQKLLAKQITQVSAAQRLNLSTRQVRRLVRSYQREGPKGLCSKRLGLPSNHQLDTQLKQKVVHLIRTRYPDFGPTFANEKLRDVHGITLSVETTRQLMICAGIWKGKTRKRPTVHMTRSRRTQLGELVQIDGSPHDWFEGRRAPCCLLAFIDDATGAIMTLYFVETECTDGYFDATMHYLAQHGRPVAVYSDRHSIFRVNTPEAKSGQGKTQYGRALEELGIQQICAKSPQAKGRVERLFGTLQDRLVKELRLRGISACATANAYLPEFIAAYNRRFAVAPMNDADAHRLALPNKEALQHIFCEKCVRKVTKNLTISYENILYQIQTKTPSYTMRGANVEVHNYKGDVTLWYKGKELAYTTFDKHNRPTPVVSRKALDSVLTNSGVKPKAEHPWRQYKLTQQRKAKKIQQA